MLVVNVAITPLPPPLRIFLATLIPNLCRSHTLQRVDPGRGLVPQRSAAVRSVPGVAEGQPCGAGGRHEQALDHNGVLAEVGQCAERPPGQAQDPT